MTRPHPALLDLARGRAATVGHDEQAFLRSAAEHRMLGAVLVAHQSATLRLSPGAAQLVSVADLAERRRHLLFWDALAHIQSALQPLASVAVLKGIATEARWYQRLGQRPCLDLDLFLEPASLDHAVEVVRTLDASRGCWDAIAELVPRRELQHVDLCVLGVRVDLHFDPLKIGLPTRQLHQLWNSCEVLETAHGSIRVLCPEAELVMLLLHLNKDRFSYLGPFLDIARITASGGLDWSRVGSIAWEEGMEVPVWKSLAAVSEVVGLDLEVPRVAGVRGRTWDLLWGPGKRLAGDEGRRGAPSVQPVLALHARGRRRDNLRETRRQLLPGRRLLEVAGRVDPGVSYLRHITVRRATMALSNNATSHADGPAAPGVS